jgi:hypothetical protein
VRLAMIQQDGTAILTPVRIPGLIP